MRSAVLRALPPLLGVEQAWHLLGEATHDDAPQVLQAVAEASPWDLAAAHRARCATLVDASYDACLASYDGYASYGLLQAMAVWARYAPELSLRLCRTVCDLDSREYWRYAAWALRDLAASDVPHPVGGAAAGSALHAAVSELLAAMHTPEGGLDALKDRDLPALQRLRTLVSPASDRPERPETLRAIAAQLAPEPRLAAERAELLSRLVDRTEEPDTLLERLRELADALEGAGVTVSVRAAGQLGSGWMHGALPERLEASLTAAERLARDGGNVTGLLAAGLVTGTGVALGWPEEWRAVLRLLRGHPHPDVRQQAYATMTEME
ncbi:hypothetical protein ABZ471_17050 [Streptomyces sp. NPDC005728]|uniref:hypothetical protein n=1 Tax=Streptomyces sp. NPDC005728 TaxID=3157054 RepID=UPI0033DFCEEF